MFRQCMCLMEFWGAFQVWDAGSGNLLQRLPADLPILDICPFQINQEHYLASLTEKMIKTYKWEQNNDRGFV